MMKKQHTADGYYDPRDYTLVHNNHLRHLTEEAHLTKEAQPFREQVEACAEYLMDGETPAECIARWRKSIDSAMRLLEQEKFRAEAAEAALAQQAQEIARVKRYLAGYGLAGRQALTDLFPDTLRPHGEES